MKHDRDEEAVRLRRLISAEGALILGGLGIAASGAAIDIWATTSGLIAGGNAGHDELLGFNLPIVGLAFIAFGLLMAQPPLFLGKGYRRLYVAAVLLLADGLLHMAVIAPHLEHLPQAVFFGVVAAVQVFAGLTLPESPRQLRDDWLLLSVFLIGLYVASRTAEVPFLFGFEPVDSVGVVSKVIEGLLILVLLTMRNREFDEGLRAVRSRLERGEGLPHASR